VPAPVRGAALSFVAQRAPVLPGRRHNQAPARTAWASTTGCQRQLRTRPWPRQEPRQGRSRGGGKDGGGANIGGGARAGGGGRGGGGRGVGGSGSGRIFAV